MDLSLLPLLLPVEETGEFEEERERTGINRNGDGLRLLDLLKNFQFKNDEMYTNYKNIKPF